jgi:pSer/pThr/pTyr-binding forkhead associated (FHA) protein
MGAAHADEAVRARSAAELKRLIELDRDAVPYLVIRDADDRQVEVVLDAERPLVVGRGTECDLTLAWDDAASRTHAEMLNRGGSWFVLDDGISRNGTFVNGERVHGRRRLRDGDVLTFGKTPVRFRCPEAESDAGTAAATGEIVLAQISPGQRKVLIALCRPSLESGVPATNREIAGELHLSEEAVKSHLRALFHHFGIEDLPQNAKRVRLAQLALRGGVVTPPDLL